MKRIMSVYGTCLCTRACVSGNNLPNEIITNVNVCLKSLICLQHTGYHYTYVVYYVGLLGSSYLLMMTYTWYRCMKIIHFLCKLFQFNDMILLVNNLLPRWCFLHSTTVSISITSYIQLIYFNSMYVHSKNNEIKSFIFN